MNITIKSSYGLSRTIEIAYSPENTIITPNIVQWSPQIQENLDSDFVIYQLHTEGFNSQVVSMKPLSMSNISSIPNISEYGAYITVQNILHDNFVEEVKSFLGAFAVLPDLYRLLDNPSQLLPVICRLKENFKKPVLAMNIHPYYFPILTYLGIDLYDTISLDYLAAHGITLGLSGEFSAKTTENVKDHYEIMLQENNDFAHKLINEIQKRTRSFLLRDLVKISANWHPTIRTILRLIDRESLQLISDRIPSYSKNPVLCSDSSDLFRPEVLTFSNRIKERYFPLQSTKYVLLLPCSARKPYSESKSHQLFENAIRNALSRSQQMFLSKLIVTSPLGIVPHILEEIYPAAHYDISVTGNWYEEEKTRIHDLLRAIIPRYAADTRFIVYLPENESPLVQEVLPEEKTLLVSATGSLTSQKSLILLENALKELNFPSDSEGPRKSDVRKNYFANLIDFQFGKESHTKFPIEDLVIKERQNQRYLELDGENFAKIDQNSGLLLLEPLAATYLVQNEIQRVTFSGKRSEFKGSSLLVAGVAKVDPNIHPGDEVVVVDITNEIIGLGKAALCSQDMTAYNRGLAVEIRKKV